jgi:hypothetical protein
LTVTDAGVEVTLMEVGVKVNAVRDGGVMSLTEFTVRAVGKPLAATSLAANSKVFPTASVINTEDTVHAPASLKRGKVATAEVVTAVEAAKVPVADWVWAPDGLVNTT